MFQVHWTNRRVVLKQRGAGLSSTEESTLEQRPHVAPPIGDDHDHDFGSHDAVDEPILPQHDLAEVAYSETFEFLVDGATHGKLFETFDDTDKFVE